MSGGKTNKPKERTRYQEMDSNEHEMHCRCKQCRMNKKAKRDESVIGRKPGKESAEQQEPDSVGSTTDRVQQRAMKLEPRNRIVFRCPNCDTALRMMVTKRNKWDDSDSLSDAKEKWSDEEAE